MKNLIFLVILLLIVGCSKVTEVTVTDANQDSVYRIGSESGLLGNVDMHIIPWTIQGSAIILLNGPGSNIGYDIRKRDDSAFIYFADSYISTGGYSLQSGTQLPIDEWLRVRLVIYESGLAGWIVSFLQALGLDFFESLENYMIEEIYEVDLILEGDSQSVRVEKWKKISLESLENNF